MKLRADLTKREVVDSTDHSQCAWVTSPTPGVLRKMLERDGDEVARATTIVKYDPASSFPLHTHSAGEEFIVLDGIFSDEFGHYSELYYVRNAINSKHQPFSTNGCRILVKLRQMTDETEENVIVDTLGESQEKWIESEDKITGKRTILPLFRNDKTGEVVWYEKWDPNTSINWKIHEHGEEIFVLRGQFKDNTRTYGTEAWIRIPASEASTIEFRSTAEGCLLFFKAGHFKQLQSS